LARTHEKKEELIQKYGARLAGAQVMIWAQYRGIRVSQLEQLRRQLRPLGAQVMVIKNALMRLALDRADLPRDPEMMTGPCAVTFAYDNISTATKAVVDFARTSGDTFQVKGGLVNGKPVGTEQIISLSKLPPRDILLAQVVGGIQAPISGFVGVLAAAIRSLLIVLNARGDQLEAGAI